MTIERECNWPCDCGDNPHADLSAARQKIIDLNSIIGDYIQSMQIQAKRINELESQLARPTDVAKDGELWIARAADRIAARIGTFVQAFKPEAPPSAPANIAAIIREERTARELLSRSSDALTPRCAHCNLPVDPDADNVLPTGDGHDRACDRSAEASTQSKSEETEE